MRVAPLATAGANAARTATSARLVRVQFHSFLLRVVAPSESIPQAVCRTGGGMRRSSRAPLIGVRRPTGAPRPRIARTLQPMTGPDVDPALREHVDALLTRLSRLQAARAHLAELADSVGRE